MNRLIYEASLRGLFLLISNRIEGSLVYEKREGEIIWISDTNIDDLNLCYYSAVYDSIKEGKSMSVVFSDKGLFEIELFHQLRVGGYKEPYHKVIDQKVDGYSVSECLATLNDVLNQDINIRNI